jgi:hypothetical protein
VPGILCEEDDGYFISCLLCGYIVRDWGYHQTSFKETFAQFAYAKKQPDEDLHLHRTPRRKESYPHGGLERISQTLDSCCRAHNGLAGRLPVCKECEQRYDGLAEKSVDDRIDSTDILDSFRFKQEALLK